MRFHSGTTATPKAPKAAPVWSKASRTWFFHDSLVTAFVAMVILDSQSVDPTWWFYLNQQWDSLLMNLLIMYKVPWSMHKAPKVQEKSEVERICYYWLLKGYTFEIPLNHWQSALWHQKVMLMSIYCNYPPLVCKWNSCVHEATSMLGRGYNFPKACLCSLVLTAPSVARRALLGFAQ